MENTRSNTPKEKESLLAKIRSNPKCPLKAIPISLLVVLPFCICLIGTVIFGLHYIRDKAYNYSDVAYKNIVAAIQGGEIEDADGNRKEIPASVKKGIGIDTLELPKYVDKFTLTYENGQIKLICSSTYGYFTAEVTAEISSNYTITSMSANYASLGDYMDQLLRAFGLVVLVATLLGFFALEGLIFGGLFLYGLIYNKVEARKEKEEDPSAQSNLGENPLAAVGASAQPGQSLVVQPLEAVDASKAS